MGTTRQEGRPAESPVEDDAAGFRRRRAPTEPTPWWVHMYHSFSTLSFHTILLMAIRTRDRKRAEAHNRVVAGLYNTPRNKPVGRPTNKKQASPEQLAFRAYIESGMSPEQARIEAGLPPLR